MKRAITVGATTLMLTGALSGIAVAQTEAAAAQPADDDNDELGLWGLAGIIGLAGLIKRKSHDDAGTRR